MKFNRSEQELYDIEHLDEGYKNLAESIARNVSQAILNSAKTTNSYRKDNFWDGKVFTDFFWGVNKVFQDKVKFALKESNLSEMAASRVYEQGIKYISAKKIMQFSAWAQNTPLSKLLQNYVSYCDDIKFEPEAFKGQQEIVRKIRVLNNPELFSYEDPFADDISRLTQDYFERPFISKEINSYIEQNDRGYITLRAGGGCGKSAILAHTVKNLENKKELVVVKYFIRHGEWSSQTYSFVQELKKQVENNGFDLSQVQKHFDTLHALQSYSYVVDLVLQEVSKQRSKVGKSKILFVIDALDEIADNDPIKLTGSDNLLGLPKSTPPGVFILISSRNDSQQDFDLPSLHLPLHESEPHQINDIRAFIAYKYDSNKNISNWARDNKLDKTSFVELLSKKSEYRFIYLHCFFSSISDFSLDSEELPQGLNAYYETQYQRLLIKSPVMKLVFAGIVYFPPEISLDRLALFSNLVDKHEICHQVEHGISIAVIDQIIRRMLFFRLSHLSFYEFLKKKVEYSNPSIFFEAFRRISDDLKSCIEISRKGKTIHLNRKMIHDLRRETFSTLVTSLLCQEDERSSLSLVNYLTSPAFCREYIEAVGHDERKLLKSIECTFNNLISLGMASDASEFLSDFIINIESCHQDDAILDRQSMQNYLCYDQNSKLYKTYYDQLEKAIFRSEANAELEDLMLLVSKDTLKKLMNPDRFHNFLKAVRDRYRSKGLYEDAAREFSKLKDVIVELLPTNTDFTYVDLARIEWETGYLKFMAGDYAGAIPFFEENNRYSKMAGDDLGLMIGQHCLDVAEGLGGLISFEEAMQKEIGHLNSIPELIQKGADSNRCNTWVHTISKWIFYFAVEAGNLEKAQQYYDHFIEHPTTVSGLNEDNIKTQTLLHYFSLHAHLYFLKGQYEKAMSWFARYLKCDLFEWGTLDVRLGENYEIQTEIARDYLFAGMTLSKLGMKEKAELVFKKGLKALDANNHSFKRRIQAQLALAKNVKELA